MSARALLTGASGFVGTHLAAHLDDLGVEVVGATRHGCPPDWRGEWRRLDIRHLREVEEVVSEVRPSVVFHLASAARDAPLAELLDVNVAGTAQLLDVVARTAPGARVLVTGSAAEYGHAPASELPLDERAALRPLGPYGVSKCAQSLVSLAAARTGLDVVLARTFNLVGPGEPKTLVCGAFAAQIAAREVGSDGGPIKVGNLGSQRDFIDVRDAVRAYALAAFQGASGEVYNVCSGVPTRISDLLRMLLGKARTQIEVAEAGGTWATDVPVQFGNASRLAAAVGWAPAISLDQSLDDLLEWWRDRLERKEAGAGAPGR